MFWQAKRFNYTESEDQINATSEVGACPREGSRHLKQSKEKSTVYEISILKDQR